MSCGNKTKNTCGEKTYATCVYYEKEVPTFSELTDCITLEETTEELYDLVKDLKEQIDLSELGECDDLDYVLDSEDNRIIVKNVLIKYEEEICALKAKVEELETKNISEMLIADWGLDLDCLELPCEATIATVKDLFQSLINKVCNP